METKKLVNAYDIADNVRVHTALSRLPYDVIIDKIRWEHVLQDTSTKVALLIINYGIVAIYDIFNESDPVIIQQDTTEGLEDFYWIRPVKEQLTRTEGSYNNSIQLLVYTKNNLIVKLYSLDCSQVVWKFYKPISTEPLFNSDNSNLWLLVLHSRSAAISDQDPVIYHFYNDGSVSKLLYRFKLSSGLFDQFELSWSMSGKWLIYFNLVDPLFGFVVLVFNCLGVNQRKFNLSDLIPTGDPIVNIKWMPDGIEGDVSPMRFGASNYMYTTISIDDINDYILVVSGESRDIEVLTISIKDFRIINRCNIRQLTGARIWREDYDGDTIGYIGSRAGGDLGNFTIKKVLTLRRNGSMYLVVQLLDAVLVNEIILNDETSNSLVLFKPVHFITTEKVTEVSLFGDSLIIETLTHILVFDFSSVTVLYQDVGGLPKHQMVGTEVVVYDGPDDWRNINPKKPLEHKRLVADESLEYTDTFMNKRLRKT